MPTQYTSPYNLPWPQIGDPVKDGAAAIEGIAKAVNTALVNGSFPASNPDVASMTARLNALEAATTVRRMEFKTSAPFSVAASQPWDIGPLSVDAGANKQVNGGFANTTGALSGAVNITESGFYVATAFVIPTGTPGMTWVSVNIGTEKVTQGGNNGNMWESMAHINIPTYIAAGSYIRCSYVATTAHSINSILTVQKVSAA